MKSEVYSWRLSTDLKPELEREARARKIPVSTALDEAAREWLKMSPPNSSEGEEQRRIHEAAAECFGVLAGKNASRAESARQTIRQRLKRRYAL